MIPRFTTTSTDHTNDAATTGRSRPRRALAASLVGVMLLAACGSDDDADAPDTTLEPLTADDIGETDERDGEEGSDEPETTDTTSTTSTTLETAGDADADAGASDPVETTTTTAAPAAETTTTTTTEPAGGTTDVACIVGQWRLRDQDFVDQLAASVAADTGVGDVDWSYVSGEYLYDINPDGTTRGQRIAWTTRLSSPEGAIITTIDSDDPGTWSVEGSTISIVDEGSTATVTTGIEIGGVVQPLPGGGQTVGTEGLSGSGTFECGDDVISITLTDLPDAPPGGFTVTLEQR